MEFRPTLPGERDAVRQFLASVFQTGLDARFVDSALCDWKFYAPRPGWPGSRSYVIEAAGAYAAHGCLVPMPFAEGPTVFPACQIIDWAGDPRFAGIGMALRRKIESMAGICCGVGGSEDTLKVLPRSGYRAAARYFSWAAVVRPIRQAAARPRTGLLKDAARAARNLLWSLKGLPAPPNGWELEPVQFFTAADVTCLAGATGFIRTVRSAELLNYLLACPKTNMYGYRLRKNGAVAGTVLVSRVEGSTRIADVQLATGDSDDWRAATTLALRAAADIPETCEIVASGALPVYEGALASLGLRKRAECDLFINDRANPLPALPIHLVPADYDGFYGFSPSYPFLT